MSSSVPRQDTQQRERILNAICEAAVKIVGVDHSGLVLFDVDRQMGTVMAEYPSGNTPAVGRRIQISGIEPEENLAKDGTPIVFSDVESNTSLGPVRSLLLGLGIKSIVVVPIIVDGEITGSFSFDSIDAARSFRQLDIDRCKSLADFASLVIRNAYQLDELEPLSLAMLAIFSPQEREPLLKAITVQAVTLLKADSGGIDELDEARDELSVIAAYNLPDEIIGQTLKIGQGVAGQLIRSDLEFMAVPNYAEWEFRARYKNVDVLESVVGVPLSSDKKRTGVLWVNAARGHIFRTADIDLLRRLAVFAGVALEQSRERDRAVRLEKLRASTFEILSRLTTDNRKDRLTLIARHAHEIVNAEACEILLVEEPGSLTLVASDGRREGGFKEGLKLEIVDGVGTGLTGSIAQQRLVFRAYGHDLLNHPALKKRRAAGHIGPGFSLLAIPLITKSDELKGILRISNKRDKDGRPNARTGFSEDDQSIGEFFAQVALVAIEAADLLDRAKLGESRYKTVLDASRVLAQARVFDNGLQALAEMIVGVLGKSFCRISLYNETEESLQAIAAVKNVNMSNVSWNPHLGEISAVSRWPGLAESLASGQERVFRSSDSESNLESLARWIELRNSSGEPVKIRSMMRIPLRVESTVGLMLIGDTDSDDFQQHEIAQAVAISEQISLLIERLRSDKKLIQEIFKIESEINASNDLKKTLNLVASLVYDVTHRWGRGITVADVNLREGDKVLVEAAHPPERLPEIRKIIGDFDLRTGKDGRLGIVGRAIKNGESIIVPDVEENDDYFPIHDGTRSQLVVPIKGGEGEILGAISAEGSQLGAFDDEDRVIIEGLASQASSAIGKDRQSRENKKVRTIALVGAAGSIWKHSLKGHADLIRSEVEASLLELTDRPDVGARLNRIWDRAGEVLEFPFTGPLSENLGISVELLNDVIQERLRSLRTFLGINGQDATLEPDLSQSNGLEIQINKSWFQYALKIFLVNAREAVYEKEIRKISLITEKVGDSFCRIVITNTGPKIPDPIWQKLGIEQIERGDGNRERGVGLLIADLILAVYGGKFEKIKNEDNNVVMGVLLPIKKQF